MRVTSIFVPAAGLGTRLRPLTERVPKALVPIGDAPMLAHVLAALEPLGVPIAVNAHHRREAVARFIRERPAAIVLSEEPELLGTAGGLVQAHRMTEPKARGATLVWNADVWLDLSPADFAEAAAQVRDVDALLAVRRLPAGEGNVGLDRDDHVVRLRRETVREGEVTSGEFVAVHAIGAKLRDAAPERGCLVEDVYLPALRRGARLGVFAYDGPFEDIGTVASYVAANRAWLRAHGLDAFVAKSARVAPGVRALGSVVGEGARVESAGAPLASLENVVVWPGARATAPLRDAVVMDDAAIVPIG